MKDFHREDLRFSLCGLNCALCPMQLDGYCPGCGGGAGNQSCKIARCSLDHGGMDYCFQCGEYPCGRYGGIDEFDSFITHQNQKADLARMERLGPDGYHAGLAEKAAILHTLLDQYNDGRRKTLFCTAVNLLELEDLRPVLAEITAPAVAALPLKARGARAAGLLGEAAKRRGIELKLRRKK